MKRTLSILLVAFFCCISMMADGIDKISGSNKFLKTEGVAKVTINWENATWDSKGSVKDQWKDEYQKHVDGALTSFISGFNKKSKKVKIYQDNAKATIAFEITVTNVDYFFSAMSFLPGHKHTLWGDVVAKDIASGEVLCKWSMNRFKGGRDFVVYDSFTKMWKELGEELAN